MEKITENGRICIYNIVEVCSAKSDKGKIPILRCCVRCKIDAKGVDKSKLYWVLYGYKVESYSGTILFRKISGGKRKTKVKRS